MVGKTLKQLPDLTFVGMARLNARNVGGSVRRGERSNFKIKFDR